LLILVVNRSRKQEAAASQTTTPLEEDQAPISSSILTSSNEGRVYELNSTQMQLYSGKILVMHLLLNIFIKISQNLYQNEDVL